jgi:3(or 17)beta-hydroxysteroid dehydrogenase
MSTKRLEGRVALVTGGARGIGKETCRLFIEEGASVFIGDIDNEEGERAAEELGAGALFLLMDVSQEADWVRAAKIIDTHFGRLDVLVNNAGITGFAEDMGPQDPEHASLESWRHVHAVNADGVFLGCKHAIPLMRKSKAASIVNVSSRSGLVGIPGAAAYASSKASVRNHSKTVALYCAQQGYPIRCNSVHPGSILTPMWEPMLGEGPEREERIRFFTKDAPLKRFGTAREAASSILFLACDDSSYVTGTELHVDGGILAGSAGSPSTKR